MFDQDTIDAIDKVATDNGFETAALLAVADVESAGVAFWTVNGKQVPAIRFEGHYFYARLNDADRATAVAQGLASPTAGAIPNPSSFAGRYDLLMRAEAINKDAALESISMGLGQVMGANWQSIGYASVEDMWNEAQSVAGQVDLMVKFIIHNNLKRFIDDSDWKSFAAAYNGAGYAKNSYDTKLAAAVAKYRNPTLVPTQLSSDEVSQIQKMLNTVGDYKLDIDGVMGTGTKTAIRDYQLKTGLTVDGVYGPITRTSLQRAYLAIVNQKTANTGLTMSAASTAGAMISETTKNIQAINSTSWILQGLCVLLVLVGLGLTLKATVFRKDS